MTGEWYRAEGLFVQNEVLVKTVHWLTGNLVGIIRSPEAVIEDQLGGGQVAVFCVSTSARTMALMLSVGTVRSIAQ